MGRRDQTRIRTITGFEFPGDPDWNLVFRVDVRPMDISVNNHFLQRGVTPNKVRAAMKKIGEEAVKAAALEGFELGIDELAAVYCIFEFIGWSGDVDNPMKRTIDAVTRAFKFPDNRVVEQYSCKRIVAKDVSPGMIVCIRSIPAHMVPSAERFREKRSTPTWIGDEE